MPRIAITGATGFLGRRLVPKLVAAGYDVRLATRAASREEEQISLFQIDLVTACDASLGSFLSGCDTLIHMAGEIVDESKMYALHVDSTRRLANAATAAAVPRWLQLSSCGVYGSVRSGTVVESCAKFPIGEYETTKWQSEQIACRWACENDKQVTILRPSIIWADDMPNNSLRSLIGAISSGLFFYVGRPGANYPAVHADDVADAILLAIQNPSKCAAFNVSENIPIETLVSTIADILRLPAPWIRVPEFMARLLATTSTIIPAMPLTPGRVDALCSHAIFSSEAIKASLGWQPKVQLRDGLDGLVKSVVASKVHK